MSAYRLGHLNQILKHFLNVANKVLFEPRDFRAIRHIVRPAELSKLLARPQDSQKRLVALDTDRLLQDAEPYEAFKMMYIILIIGLNNSFLSQKGKVV